ncbi:MAG: UbiD family decarboxylase, partial [Chloroflexi bacterium]|nr:UbiD family decarboxylase [Chloroflexota bacterium]
MNFKDIREFIEFLDKRGDLQRITTQVDADLEITEITDRIIKSGGPALLFENVTGSDTTVAINLLGTHQRTAWALGVENIEELTARVRKLLGLAQGPPTGLMGKVRALGDLVSVARTQPKTVRRAPCQEVVITGDDVDLNILPALKCWPQDAGRYITLPLVISRDPE